MTTLPWLPSLSLLQIEAWRSLQEEPGGAWRSLEAAEGSLEEPGGDWRHLEACLAQEVRLKESARILKSQKGQKTE